MSLAQSVQVVIRGAYSGRSQIWTPPRKKEWLVRYRTANNVLGFLCGPKLRGHSQITMDYLVATLLVRSKGRHQGGNQDDIRRAFEVLGENVEAGFHDRLALAPVKWEAKWDLNRKTGGWFKQILFQNFQSLAGNKHIRNLIGLWLKSISFPWAPIWVWLKNSWLPQRLQMIYMLMILKCLKPVVPIPVSSSWAIANIHVLHILHIQTSLYVYILDKNDNGMSMECRCRVSSLM